jgi:CBS domain-containing protein
MRVSTVKNCLDRKSNAIISVTPGDYVVRALELMKSHKVRSILVIESDVLMGIVSQGDCAIKVLLPGQDAKQVKISDIMTANPICVGLKDELDQCMGLMATRNIRHLPVVERQKVIGVVSIGDIVKFIISQQEDQIKTLETYIKGHGAT